MTRRKKYIADTISSKEYLSDVLKLRSFDLEELQSIVRQYETIAREKLDTPSTKEPGPLMLRTSIQPPELEAKLLEGKQAIGIDIGGTNLRIGVGQIKGGKIEPQGEIIKREIKIKYGSTDEFFQMLLDNGLSDILEENPDIPLACIFSFPGSGIVTNDGLDQTIPRDELTKEWEIRGIAGKNLGEELNNFLEKNGLRKRQYFIANDTVALIKDKETDFGVVCASGFNLSAVFKNEIINSESGSANTAQNIPVITDKLLNLIAEEENKPVDQIPVRDEYRISGKYLGRTLGLIIDELRSKYPSLFKRVKNTDFLKSFVISDILSGRWEKVKRHFGSKDNIGTPEREILTRVALTLRDVSAQLVAAHLVALHSVTMQDKNKIIISSDGPIIQNMPGWKEMFLETIKSLTGEGLEVKIIETPYQGKMKEYRGIFDVMYQAIDYFARKEILKSEG